MSDDSAQIAGRKREHIQIVLDDPVASGLSAGFERYRLVHAALPDLDLAAVDSSTRFLGKALAAPLLISGMTGGVDRAGEINRRLATAAQALGVAMGVGSQRIAIQDPALAPWFQVRQWAPDILLIANLGAVQLNCGYGPDECRRAVEMIDADALALHLNPLQEAVQAGGNTNWSGLLGRIEDVCSALDRPVIVKEVGWGISGRVARQLADAGVSAIDCGGAGGTSWSEVERRRAPSERLAAVAGAFADWGIPTSESLLMVRAAVPDLPVIASGGLRSGVDAAKAIALGADLAGIAAPLLRAAAVSESAAHDLLAATIDQLRISMFACGAGNLAALRKTELVHDGAPRWP
ncbi:MAG: type 2 isopentenyl-diphosphate Delta-isomerase [Thermomicrobiales bacterium]